MEVRGHEIKTLSFQHVMQSCSSHVNVKRTFWADHGAMWAGPLQPTLQSLNLPYHIKSTGKCASNTDTRTWSERRQVLRDGVTMKIFFTSQHGKYHSILKFLQNT